MPGPEPLTFETPPHRNQNLFSDHYLNTNLPAHTYWNSLRDPAQGMIQEISRIFASYVPSENERQTEEGLVMPVLKLLGHDFELVPSLKTPEGVYTPDYVFYKDAIARDANKDQILCDTLPQQGGIGVGDAKYWGRPLDIAIKQGRGDALSNKNPSFQIYYYILHSGVSWGILTNGKKWRLYHRETAHKLDHFYEVDLEELVQSGDVARFLYFYAFFRREAFDEGPLSVAAILRESTDYARSVGDSLKQQVYDALRYLAQGFLDYGPNRLKAEPATLDTIHKSSLILLYRLIFILYAEARGLLPLRESQPYRDTYSLYSIKNQAAADLDARKFFLSDSALLWPRLQQLFDAINRGNPPLSVATFNGGLFDPDKHSFLNKKVVGDKCLMQAIDKLARVNGAFVDYRDLSVRHMGTIYEGLLEHHLCPLDAPEEGWTVELVNDKGERKATGSYYTPDYIVSYIVDKAVGPTLQRAVDGKQADADKVQAVLEVNVLDPAMGSGHFLVEATEYIARFLVDLGVAPEGKTVEEADLAFWKRRVVQSCVYGVDLNPLAVELAKLSLWLTTVAKDRPLSFLDHHLRPGNSLVGARLADLEKAPQARKGGKRKPRAQLAEEAGQGAFFANHDFTYKMSTAVSSMWLIEQSAASNVAEVKKQEKLYEQLRKMLVGKYARVLSLITATHFGLQLDGWVRSTLVQYVTGNSIAAFPRFEKLLEQSDEIAERERFFHWELEFPEVYFDRHGRRLGEDGGFEVVIGNPPYVRQEQLGPYKPYLERRFAMVYSGPADLYAYFFARGVQELQRNGTLAFIASGMFRRLKSGAPLRRFLSTATTVERLVDYTDRQLFSGAVTYPVIAVLAKREPPPSGSTLVLEAPGPSGSTTGQPTQARLPRGDAPWVFSAVELQRLIHGWDDTSPLREIVQSRVFRGVTTGCNDAFVIDRSTRDLLLRDDAKCSAILKPFIRGEDLHPWSQQDAGKWLIFARRGIDISAYPSVEAHLLRFRERLEPRPRSWPTGKAWPGRKPGNYQWYEIQDSVDYYTVFEGSRIHSTKVSLYPAFSLLEEPRYAANTSYVIPIPDSVIGHYVLGVLNSHVCEYFCRNVFAPKQNGYYEVQPERLEQMPVPIAPKGTVATMGALTQALSDQCRARYALHCCVRHRLSTDFGTPDAKLNQKLTSWWDMDFPALREELRKAFRAGIPVDERDQWEVWFAEQRAEHDRLTGEIIQLESELNDRVYALYGLSKDEIELIEESTKYHYGQV